VFVSARRDAKAARQFFEQAIGTTKGPPMRWSPIKRRCTWRYLTNWSRQPGVAPTGTPTTASRPTTGRLKARLRPMRGLKQDRSARVVIAGHAFVQNIRRAHYELAVEEPVTLRLAVAFDELAVAI
jgi:transposase, IS6 family